MNAHPLQSHKSEPPQDAFLRRDSKKLFFLAVIIFVAASYLSLKQLGETYFWDDESLVGIGAKNFLQTGRLTGWDGRNLLTFRNGTILDQNLRLIIQPLDIFVAAASFKIFRLGTWSARFLFVLAGLVSLICFAFLLRLDFEKDSPLWIFGLTQFSFSTAFLLNVRQCRYYSLSILFSLLTFFFYRKCLQNRQFYWYFFIGLSSVLMFFSNLLIGAAFLFSLALNFLIFKRKEFNYREWWKPGLSLGIFLLATIPYSLAYRPWNRPDMLKGLFPWYFRWLLEPRLILDYFIATNLITILPWMSLLILIYLMSKNWKKEPLTRKISEWRILGFGFIFFLSLLTSHQTPQGDFIAEIRYLAPLIPLFSTVTGSLVWLVYKRTQWGSILLLIIMLTSNVLTLTPFQTRFRWLLPAYLKEIHSPYPTNYQAVSDFLSKNAKQDDTVMAHPDFANYPLMFYLGDKVKFGPLLSKITPLTPEPLKNVSAPLFIEEKFPDWVILFSSSTSGHRLLNYLSRPHQEEGKTVQFQYQPFAQLDVYWEATQRPELNWHSSGPRKAFNKGI